MKPYQVSIGLLKLGELLVVDGPTKSITTLGLWKVIDGSVCSMKDCQLPNNLLDI